MDDLMAGTRVELGAVRIRIADNISYEFHDGKLHTKT